MRFGLSPDANPIASALDSYSKLSNTFIQQDQNKRAQRESDLRDQRATEEEPVRQLELQSRSGRAKAEVGQQEEDERVKSIAKEDRPHLDKIHAFRAQLAQAQIDGTAPPEPDLETIEAGTHFALKSGFKDIHEAAGVTAANAQLAQVLPGVHQEVVKAIQGGQKQGRIDNPQLIGLVNKAQVFGKQPISSFLFDEEGNVIPVGPTVDKDGKATMPQPFTDEKGNVIKIPSKQLYQQTAHMAGAASFITGIAAAHDAVTDPKALATLEARATTATTERNISKTQAAFQKWLADNPDATVTVQRSKLSELAGANGIDSKTAKGLETNVIQEKTTKPRNLQKLQSGASDVLIDPDAEGGPKQVWKGAPKPKQETGGGLGLPTKAELRRDKFVKEAKADLLKDPEWSTVPVDEREAEAERIADARISGKTPGKNPEKVAAKEKIKPLKDHFSGVEESTFGFGGTDKKYAIESALKQGWTKEDIKSAAAGTPMADAVKDYDFTKPVKKKEAAASDLPTVGKAGKILTDNQTGKRYKSDGKSWKPL
jgi:hypothetical protein